MASPRAAARTPALAQQQPLLVAGRVNDGQRRALAHQRVAARRTLRQLSPRPHITTAQPSDAMVTTAQPSAAMVTTAQPSAAMVTTAQPPAAMVTPVERRGPAMPSWRNPHNRGAGLALYSSHLKAANRSGCQPKSTSARAIALATNPAREGGHTTGCQAGKYLIICALSHTTPHTNLHLNKSTEA
jgi:hypothetical protein